MKCLKCGENNDDSFKYCKNCGAELPKHYKKCPNCQTLNMPQAVFCKECGQKIAETAEEVIEPTVNQPLKTLKKCSNCQTLNPSNAIYCKHCGENLENASEVMIVERVVDKKTAPKESALKNAKALGIISIVINFIPILGLIVSQGVGLILGILTLCKVSSAKKNENINAKTEKTLGIIGCVISGLFIGIIIISIIAIVLMNLIGSQFSYIPEYYF